MQVQEAITLLSNLPDYLEVTLVFDKTLTPSEPYTPVPTQPMWVNVPNYVAHVTCKTLQ